MRKPELFQTAYVIDKEYLCRGGQGLSDYIKNRLGHELAEKIFQECQKGERIVSVGEPYSKENIQYMQVEVIANVKVQDLIRCKDCRNWRPHEAGVYGDCAYKCNGYRREDFFCADGERTEPQRV